MPESAAAGPLTIAARFNGPDGSANGGYACGLLAAACSGPVAVTLHAPPTLDTPLRVEHKSRRVHLWDSSELVATAAPTRHQLATIAPVSPLLAGRGHYAGLDQHPYPRCFACGPERAPGDGLRLAPAPVAGRPGTVACRWVPEESVLAADGRVRAEIMWAVLDCPSGWTIDLNAAPMVLGWMRAEVLHRPAAGRGCVVTARLGNPAQGSGGSPHRVIAADSALYDETGVLLAAAATRWYSPRQHLGG